MTGSKDGSRLVDDVTHAATVHDARAVQHIWNFGAQIWLGDPSAAAGLNTFGHDDLRYCGGFPLVTPPINIDLHQLNSPSYGVREPVLTADPVRAERVIGQLLHMRGCIPRNLGSVAVFWQGGGVDPRRLRAET